MRTLITWRIRTKVDAPRSRFDLAVSRFDQENARDPNLEFVDGEMVPRELAYARRLTAWVQKLDPHASEALLLAARSQHIRRWEVPRNQFPADRAGYHRWKNHLKKFHARVTGEILTECGYDPETVARVTALNLKANFPADPDSQTLEDALCLVFLQHQFSALAAKTDRARMINALRKSWAKMSPKAREHALTLDFSPIERELIGAALAEP